MNRADDPGMADIKADLIARLPEYDAPDAHGGDARPSRQRGGL